MPTVIVDARRLYDHLGEPLGMSKFDLKAFVDKVEDLCFEFGLEYDGLDGEGTEEQPRMRIEVAASRYDLLCLEGIADALLRYIQPQDHPFPVYKLDPPNPSVIIHVGAAVSPLRPYIVGALFRDVEFKDEADFRSFIDLQDKLHQNIGRKRTLVSIGTHNFDTLTPPFRYDGLPRENGFQFVPLNQTETVDAAGMFEMLENTYLKPYLHITQQAPLTPVLLDSGGNVASVPPIINGELSKMSKDTRNVFVDITATDIRKAEIVLDVVVAFMSKKTAKPFTVEPVRVIYSEAHPGVPSRQGKTEFHHELTYPTLKTDKFKVNPEYVQRLIGCSDLSEDVICDLLPRMCMRAERINGDLLVECPISRRDILHACDIAEDIAIAKGYNNICKRAHPTVRLQNINNLSERVRRHIAMTGWRECLTFGLVAVKDCFDDLGRKISQADNSDEVFAAEVQPATVLEPKTKEFECVRTTLIPGLLKTLASNQHMELPIRLFEIGDVVCVNRKADNLIKQRRYVTGLIADVSDGLQEIHGLFDHVMTLLKVTPVYHTGGPVWKRRYCLKECQEDGAFLPGRCVSIVVLEDDREICIGRMGVIHPETLNKYGLPLPCSVFEIAIDPFLQWLSETELTAP